MLSKLSYIFSVLFLGAFFAVLFYKPVMKIQLFYKKRLKFFCNYKKVSKIAAILSWYVLVAILLFLLFALFYSNIYEYFCGISWNEFIEKMTGSFYKLIDFFPFLKTQNMKKKCMNIIFNAIDTVIPSIVEFFAQAFMKLPKMIARFAVSIIISIYLLIDGQNYVNGFNRWETLYVPKNQCNLLHSILEESKNSFFGYWKGQALDALIMGVLISFGLLVLGVPLSISIGIFAGVGNIIPYVGPIIAFSLTLFFCILEGEMKTLLFAMIYLIVIQQIDASYIGPKLLGRQVNIRPLTVLVAVLVGGTLFGAIGMIIAVPFIGILKSAIKILRENVLS